MEVDVSRWSVLGREQSGRDEGKFWLAQEPDSESHARWLWKPRRVTGGGVPARNDVSEVVACSLAAALELPAAECLYAVRRHSGATVRGVISRNVAPSQAELHNAVVYLTAVDGYRHKSPEVDESGVARGLTRLDEGYTLSAVQEVLQGVAPPPGCRGMTSFQVFVGFLVLDALIANNDRHPGNWALLNAQTPDTPLQLAPTFDHGSALGYGLTDEQRRTKSVERFVSRGRAKPFDGGPGLIDLAQEAVRRSGAEIWIERVRSLDDATIDGALEAPSGRVSDATATFIKELVQTTRGRLSDAD